MSSDNNINRHTDVPWRPAGIGQAMTWRCIGCVISRGTTLGSKGAGVRKRCATCVAAKAKREGAAG